MGLMTLNYHHLVNIAYILMSTKAARHLDETTLRKVQKHLSHSEGTSRTYEFILTEDATHAHKALKCLAEK